MTNVIQFRDYQKPVAQPASLVAQATGLVEFIEGLTAKDVPYVETESYSAPDKDSA